MATADALLHTSTVSAYLHCCSVAHFHSVCTLTYFVAHVCWICGGCLHVCPHAVVDLHSCFETLVSASTACIHAAVNSSQTNAAQPTLLFKKPTVWLRPILANAKAHSVPSKSANLNRMCPLSPTQKFHQAWLSRARCPC